MALGEPIKIRLAIEKQLAYEEEAQRQGKSLAVYIRERLEARDALGHEIIALRNTFEESLAALRKDVAHISRGIQDLEEKGSGQVAGPADRQSQIELLLLLRANTSPDKMSMIHAELRRLGIEPWTYKSEERR